MTSSFIRDINGIASLLRETGCAEIPVPLSTIADQRRLLAEELSVEFGRRLPGVFSSRRSSFLDSMFDAEIDNRAAQAVPPALSLNLGRTAISMTHDGTNLVTRIDAAEGSHRRTPLEWTVARVYCVFLLGDPLP